jgi:hypothetical protein
MDEVKSLQFILGEDQVQVAKQMGSCYQHPEKDRMLVKTTQLCHDTMTEKHEGDVGPLLPTITNELLFGHFGKEQTPMVEDEPQVDETQEHDPQADEPLEDDPQADESEEDEPQNQATADVYEIMTQIPEQEKTTRIGFTVIGAVQHMSMATIRDELDSRRERGECFHLGEELGPEYPRPAEGRTLLCISEYLYLSLLMALGEGVGGWLPSPTPELLASKIGSTGSWTNYMQIEVDGLRGWVAKQDDLG